MRIISGEKRGAKLESLPGDDTRPTTDRVKESLFNIIQWNVRGAKVLDLFGGSGGLGLEALSRGADFACFTDANPAAVKIINSNIKKLGFEDRSKVISGDFKIALKGDVKYDLIFLDPPYASDFIQQALDLISSNNVLTEEGIIVCETTKDKQFDVKDFNIRKQVCYGITKLVFLEVGDDE